MAEEFDIKTTQMETIPTINESDLLIISKANGSATYKMTVSQLAMEILSVMEFQSLDTTDKTIIGAINELGGV